MGRRKKPVPEPKVHKERTMRHPATSEPEYTDEEAEFLRAVQLYRVANRRPFPTCCEVLAVARAIGYRRVSERTDLPTFRGKK